MTQKRRNFKNRVQLLDKVNNQCELCGGGVNLCIHHKDFDKSNNSPDNAQVMCKKCHIEINKVRMDRM